ncbi:TPA: DNA distortion polypeptide 1 [Escherichia coli]
MKQINFRIPDEEYDFFEKKVRECFNISLPMFFKKVGLHTLSHDSEIRKIKADLKNDLGSESFYKDRYIPFKANDELYHGLKENAEKHGWSLSKEIRFRLKHTMNNDLDFFDQELDEMHACRNQIRKIGININMILRRDEGRVLDKDGFKKDIDELKNQLSGLENRFNYFLKKCRGRITSSKGE